jgi:hypothetical protein
LDSSASSDIDWATRLTAEAKEIGACASILASTLFQKNLEVVDQDIVKICYTLDEMTPDPDLFVSRQLELRRRALVIQRYEWLAKLL